MFLDPVEFVYQKAIEDIAKQLVGMAIFHHKSYEKIGQDLNKAVAEILKREGSHDTDD
jgi:hypothetical protein